MSINRKSLLIFAAYLLVWGEFACIYVNYISEVFRSEGYNLNWTFGSVLIGVTSFSTLVLISIWSDTFKFSNFFIHLMMLVSILPMSILYSFAGRDFDYYLLVLYACSILIFSLKIPFSFRIFIGQFSDVTMWRFFMFVSLLYLVVIYSYNGVDTFNLNVGEVYNFRDAAFVGLPIVMSYLLSLVSKVMLPICGVISIKLKNYIGLFFVCFVAILLYGFTSHKSVFFLLFVLIVLYYFLLLKNSVLNIIGAMVVLLGVGAAVLEIGLRYENNAACLMLGSLLIRRSLVLPADINYSYYDFFVIHDYVYWSDSKLSFGLLDLAYQKSIPEIIGDIRFPDLANHANTGWLGAGYAQAGFLGMVIYALIISFYLKCADSMVQQSKDEALAMAVLLVPSLVLMTSSDLPTAFLTHGLIYSLLILSVMQRKY